MSPIPKDQKHQVEVLVLSVDVGLEKVCVVAYVRETLRFFSLSGTFGLNNNGLSESVVLDTVCADGKDAAVLHKKY